MQPPCRLVTVTPSLSSGPRMTLKPTTWLLGSLGSLQAFSWRLQLKRKTHAEKESIRWKQPLSITSSQKKGTITSAIFCGSPEHPCQDQGPRFRMEAKTTAGWETAGRPRGRPGDLLLPCLSVSHPSPQMEASRFLLKKPVIPMDIH